MGTPGRKPTQARRKPAAQAPELKYHRKAFQDPAPRSEVVRIDRAAMNEIRDIAHGLWMESKLPNANVLMLEALRRYIVKMGVAEPNFEIVMEDAR